MLFCVILTCCWVCKLMRDSQLNPGRNMDLFLPSVYFSTSSSAIKMEKKPCEWLCVLIFLTVCSRRRENVRWFWLNLQVQTSFTCCRTLLTACVCFKGVFHRVWAAAEGATDSPVRTTEEEEGRGGGWPAFWITSAGPSVNASTGARGGMPWPPSWPEFWLVWGREGWSLFENVRCWEVGEWWRSYWSCKYSASCVSVICTPYLPTLQVSYLSQNNPIICVYLKHYC